MQVTLTLDEDVVARLRQEMARTGSEMNEVVNTLLRRGLVAPGVEEAVKPFVVQAQSMGLRAGVDLDKISGLLDSLDGAAGEKVPHNP